MNAASIVVRVAASVTGTANSWALHLSASHSVAEVARNADVRHPMQAIPSDRLAVTAARFQSDDSATQDVTLWTIGP